VRHARFYDESKHSEIATAIDNWAAKHTLSKAPQVGAHLQLIEASSIGVSALYFHGIFWYPFDPKNTKTMPFFTDLKKSDELKRVAFINGKTKCRYYDGVKHNDNWTIVCLDYHLSDTDSLDRLSLVLAKRIGYNNRKESRIEKQTDHIGSKPIALNDFYAAMKKSKRQMVDLSFPKMNLESLLHLSSILEDPLDRAFDVTEADFGRISKNAKEYGLCISQLVHNVRVVIDERGQHTLSQDLLQEVAPKEEFNYPFDVYLMNSTQDQIFLCGRIADPDPATPLAPAFLRKEHDHDNPEDTVKDVNTSKWKLCWSF